MIRNRLGIETFYKLFLTFKRDNMKTAEEIIEALELRVSRLNMIADVLDYTPISHDFQIYVEVLIEELSTQIEWIKG